MTLPFYVSMLAALPPRGLRWTRFLPALCGVWLAAPLAAQTPTVPVGTEFQVNSYTLENQEDPSIAVHPSGNFVVVWESNGSPGSDTSGKSIQGQRFAANGEALGAQFQVNSYTPSGQFSPSIAVRPGGGFVVVWESNGSPGSDTSDRSIQGRRYASDGAPLGAQFQVNTYTPSSDFDPAVAVDSAGFFVVVWTSDGSPGNDDSSTSVQGRRFLPNGTAFLGQFQVNSYTTDGQSRPSIAVDPDGTFVVAWQSFGSSGSDTAFFSIQGRPVAFDGLPSGPQFQVNSYTTGAQYTPSIAVDPDGVFAVVWASQGSSGSDTSATSIQARRLASDGAPLGVQFQVNTYTTSTQSEPRVTIDSDGDLGVVWTSSGSFGSDTSSKSIQGQRFRSSGPAVGTQFQVNSDTTGVPFAPSMAVHPNGDFVVVWDGESSGEDPPPRDIQGQRFRVTADVGDKVFFDADFDGRQDGLEAGAPDVTVHLRTALGDLVSSTVTGPDGDFLFRPKIGLDAVVDRFFVEVESPPTTTFTAPDVGPDDAIDSDVDEFSGETATFVVTSAGEDQPDLDAGLIADDAVIGDRVWHDANRDGVQQVDEPGVAGVTVRLLDAGGILVAPTATDSDGLFAFSVIGTGTYTIEVGVPVGMELTDQDVGIDDEVDSDVDPTTGRSEPFAYSEASISRSHDAGLRSVVPEILFTDGFESGDLSAWSASVD